ncbi:MAG: (d)CMP kinase [Candidatus Dadabacteria bacterium]|nr:(d)CMP kinase [Candidatus Dadabacteria bacterium]MCY4046588.1 (d)CMP kinase [Candidatus Dadabacteria bacterium]
MRKVITIDGPGASGKGTVARIVARRLGMKYMDTGAMYRAFALFATERGADESEAAALVGEAEISFEDTGDGNCAALLNGRDVSALIRTPEISESASRLSRIPAVREALGRIQRAFGGNSSIVAEGRDMGTRVFADAGHKFFLTADERERARRRTAELAAAGIRRSVGETLAEMASRDARDSKRSHSPLKPAPDAVIIDTTHMSVDEVVEEILSLVKG